MPPPTAKQRRRRVSRALNRMVRWAKLIPLPTPVTGLVLDIAAICCGAGARQFTVSGRLPNGDPIPYSGWNIECALREFRGTRLWGNFVMLGKNRDLYFTVRADHARRAEYVLQQLGVTYT